MTHFADDESHSYLRYLRSYENSFMSVDYRRLWMNLGFFATLSDVRTMYDGSSVAREMKWHSYPIILYYLPRKEANGHSGTHVRCTYKPLRVAIPKVIRHLSQSSERWLATSLLIFWLDKYRKLHGKKLYTGNLEFGSNTWTVMQIVFS